MHTILTSTELRHLRFIEILIENGQGMYLKDIAKQLKCSVKILTHDLQIFDELYPFIELRREKQFITLAIQPPYNIGHVYARAINQSQNFRFLKYIFFHPMNTLEEILEHFDISQATLYRQLSVINQGLKDNFHLKLKSSPFRVVGPEEDIRQFYKLLFFESYDILEWPFSYIDEEILALCFKHFSHMTHTNFNLGDIIEAKIGVAINIQRLVYNQRIDLSEEQAHIQNLLPYIMQIQEFQDLLQQLPEHIQKHSKATIISELFYPFISNNIIYDYETILSSPDHFPNINQQLMKIHTMTIALADKYKIRIDNVSQFIIRVHNSIEFNKNNLNQSYILYDHYREVFDYVDSQFPEFSKDLDDQIYTHIFDRQLVPQYQFNTLKRSILLNWEDLFFQLSDSRSINILVINKLSVTIADFYRKFLRFNLPKNVNVMVWRHFPLNLEDLTHTSHDIIITNLMLPQIPGKKVLYMDSIFGNDDLKRIVAAIQDVRVNHLHQGGMLYAPITSE